MGPLLLRSLREAQRRLYREFLPARIPFAFGVRSNLSIVPEPAGDDSPVLPTAAEPVEQVVHAESRYPQPPA